MAVLSIGWRRSATSNIPILLETAIRLSGQKSYGAQGRDRTTDTAIFSRMLYQLSYLGTARRGARERRFIVRLACPVHLASPARHSPKDEDGPPPQRSINSRKTHGYRYSASSSSSLAAGMA